MSRSNSMTFDERFAALDDDKARFVSKVYTGLTVYMGLAAVLALLGAEWAQTTPGWYSTWRVLRFAPLAMLFIAMFVRLSGPVGWVFLTTFVALQGFVIGPIVAYYGSASAALAFGLTMFIFLGLTAYVRYSGADFTWMGGFLTIVTVCALFASLAIMIFGVSADIYLAFSVFGALLFSCWILYDTSAVTRQYYRNNDVCGAILNLFIDIVNLFLFILSIVGRRN
jgi:uncharacterized protein